MHLCTQCTCTIQSSIRVKRWMLSFDPKVPVLSILCSRPVQSLWHNRMRKALSCTAAAKWPRVGSSAPIAPDQERNLSLVIYFPGMHNPLLPDADPNQDLCLGCDDNQNTAWEPVVTVVVECGSRSEAL